MCTVIILRRPGHRWPLILGANRDERLSRPWLPPARHWPDRSDVVAGLDKLGGGSWMGLNDFGVVACILNRRGTLGPQDGKLSRGEIVLDALDHPDAAVAAEALQHLDGRAFRDFNLIIADNRDAYWLCLDSSKSNRVTVTDIPEGVSMLTAGDMNDLSSARIGTFLPQFRAAAPPDPDSDDWAAWQDLFATGPQPDQAEVAMCFPSASGYGTSSSALLALPAIEGAAASPAQRVRWLFAAGPPDSAPYEPVEL